MFGKKCPRCEKKSSKNNEFCSHCGFQLGKKRDIEEDFGLLGKEDDSFQPETRLPFGLNTLFNSLLKELDSQFKELDKMENEQEKTKRSSKNPNIQRKEISISITHNGNMPPEIKIKTFGNMPQLDQKRLKKKTTFMPIISEERIKKIAALPREEASANIRRLSNKVIYEISVPGVKSPEDVIINQLENSIEVKAISKDKVYLKLIPINFPLTKYSLKEDKLILELDTRE